MSSDNVAEQPVRAICPHAHCGKRLTRHGRADWRCPMHGDVMWLLLNLYMAEQGYLVKYVEGSKDDAPSMSN